MAQNNKVTGWVGWVYFAAFMIILAGTFQLIAGFAALLNPDYFKVVDGTLLVFDLTTWGWVHMLLGVLMLCAGTALFNGRMWARVVAMILAMFNLVAQFAFLSEYPIWSLVIIAVDILVIYALTVHGREVIED